jgi:hypothetical protein
MPLGKKSGLLNCLLRDGTPNLNWVSSSLLLYQGSQKVTSNKLSGMAIIYEKLVSTPWML